MKYRMRYPLAAILICLSLLACAAEDKKPTGTIVSFSAEASQTVSNDLARATVFAEATDTNSAAVARKVNNLMAQAIATAKGFPDVKTRSGSTWTSPIYGKDGRTITSWQMRSELQLESRDIAALGDLLGKLQGSLGVSQINLQPAPETRKKAIEQATLDALNAFQEKAKRIAGNFKKYYKVVRMNVDTSGQGPVYPMVRGAMMKMEDAAPMPIESGDSTVNATVSGEIELIE
jgi:predicted secreted protein